MSVNNVRIIEIKKSVFEDNDREADRLRKELRERGIFLLNLMSSPGAGKTTTLTRTIESLKDRFRIGVMEADIDSDVDAKKIAATGAESIQLHTGGMCHLDAGMTEQGLRELMGAGVAGSGNGENSDINPKKTSPRIARIWYSSKMSAILYVRRNLTPVP